jgi:hypothetical protein
MELVKLALNENGPPSAEKKDCFGQMEHPLELMLLRSLHHLGRGLTFNDLEETTLILESSHCNFVHKLIEIGSMFF